MSTEETEKATDSGADDEEWLYGDEDDEEGEEKEQKESSLAEGQVNDGNAAANQSEKESESDSDDDDDDDVCVTIGDIKPGGSENIAFGTPTVSFNAKPSGWTLNSGNKSKGVDMNAEGSVNGTPLLEVDVETFDEKPWRKPGADLSDYFNYGFNEETWKIYCDKQRRLRASLEVMSFGSSKTLGRSSHHSDHSLSKPDNFYESSSSSSRKLSNSINVIGGQSGTISRVEGRRRHNTDGNVIQVVSEPSSDSESTPTKMPFFPPNIPPPPLPPPPSHCSTPSLIPPPRLPISVPPPGFPPPPGAPPPSLITSLDRLLRYKIRRSSGRHSRESDRDRERSHSPISRSSYSNRSAGGYDARSAPPFPFPAGVYPPMLGGMAAWPGLIDSAKAWEYYARRDSTRDRERDRNKTRERGQERERERDRDRDRERERERDRDRERERERERSLSSPSHYSDEERQSKRDHSERAHDRHRDRSSREREERHRERRHRDKDEGRHKSSRSSSSRRKRHSSEEGQTHRRSRHKRQKRSARESSETTAETEEPRADQENQ